MMLMSTFSIFQPSRLVNSDGYVMGQTYITSAQIPHTEKVTLFARCFSYMESSIIGLFPGHKM